MAEQSTIARPYANAVFALAKQESALDRWSSMLNLLGATVQDERVQRLLDTPDVADVQKAYKLAEICGDELDDRGKRFLQVLADNDRLELIGAVRDEFEALKALEESKLEVEVVSAYPVSDDQAQRLTQALAKKFEKEVSLTSRVDDSLIGGAVIRAGDTVIDGSLRGKLEKLSETLQRV